MEEITEKGLIYKLAYRELSYKPKNINLSMVKNHKFFTYRGLSLIERIDCVTFLIFIYYIHVL